MASYYGDLVLKRGEPGSERLPVHTREGSQLFKAGIGLEASEGFGRWCAKRGWCALVGDQGLQLFQMASLLACSPIVGLLLPLPMLLLLLLHRLPEPSLRW